MWNQVSLKPHWHYAKWNKPGQDQYPMISLICEIQKYKNKKTENQAHRYRGQIGGWKRCRVGEVADLFISYVQLNNLNLKIRINIDKINIGKKLE